MENCRSVYQKSIIPSFDNDDMKLSKRHVVLLLLIFLLKCLSKSFAIRCLPKAENSIIPHRIITKYQSAYQAHLERVSDFLLCGEGIWWRHVVKAVEFFDITPPSEIPTAADTLPPLHHFYSHTLKSESKYQKKTGRSVCHRLLLQYPTMLSECLMRWVSLTT